MIWRALLGVVLVTVSFGCSKPPPVGPNADGDIALHAGGEGALAGYGSGVFYPLQQGDRWSYEGDARFTILRPGADPIELHYRYTESHTIRGTELRDGHEYVLREQVRDELVEPDGDTWTTWTRMRQDRTGLFAAQDAFDPPVDVSGSRAMREIASVGGRPLDFSALRDGGFTDASLAQFAERVARLREFARTGGVARRRLADLPGELTWLLYPLRPGTEWNIVPGLVWPARVTGLEVLRTPAGALPAYRIEVNPGGFNTEGEWARLWYGRAGYIGLSLRVISEAVDADGRPNGMILMFDDTMMITALDLAR